MKELPVIDQEKCQQCGLCVTVCGCGALRMEGDRVSMVLTDECQWCTLCELVCPSGAITCPYEIVVEDESTPG